MELQSHWWKQWKCYVNSDERDTPGIYLLSPRHPFEGSVSMQDMKLQLLADPVSYYG
jgi:hypothetical protein